MYYSKNTTSIMYVYVNKNTTYTCIVGVASGFGDLNQSSLICQMIENKCFTNAATKMCSLLYQKTYSIFSRIVIY